MGLERDKGVNTAIGAVIGCDFPVEEELSSCITGFLEYRYRRIITFKLLSEQVMLNEFMKSGTPRGFNGKG